MKRFFVYLRQYRKQVILGPFFKWLEAVFELIVPVVMARIIDVGVANGDISYVLKMGGVLAGLGAFGLGFALICQYNASVAAQGFGTNLRNALVGHIDEFSFREIDKFGPASLVTRVTNDVSQMQLAVAMIIRLAVRAPFLVLGAIVMSFLIDPVVALVVLGASVLLAVCLWLVMTKAVPFYRYNQKKLDRINLKTSEALEGARAVRAFSKQDEEKADFAAESEDLRKNSLRAGWISALLNPLTAVVVNLGIVALLWVSGLSVSAGRLTQGETVAFVNYMNQILLAMIAFANIIVIFTKAHASATRVAEVLDTENSVLPGSETEGIAGAPLVAFEGAGLAYFHAEGKALSDITFELGRGETLGVIGGTGSGKSSLINLIPRFYDATEGKVLFCGRDVREYDTAALRERIGLVPQRAELFSGTIRDNLRWGKEDATDEELWEALETAEGAEFVRGKARGLDEPVAEGGKYFSGGQKQRLTVARALVRKPELLILDDSSSALDFATDFRMRANIRRASAGSAVIVVSQRASAVKNADRILVLDDGRAVGYGTHERLLADCAVYREICLSQEKSEGREHA